MRACVEAMNSSSEPMRIGSGSTIDVSPANQQALHRGDQCPARRSEHGDVIPGNQAAACRAAATARASSWSWRHDTVTGPVGATDEPTNVTPVGEPAAACEAVDGRGRRRRESHEPTASVASD